MCESPKSKPWDGRATAGSDHQYEEIGLFADPTRVDDKRYREADERQKHQGDDVSHISPF
jgi:hypothetical protein